MAMSSLLDARLRDVDAQLQAELAALASKARDWFISGSRSGHLRTRDDGDVTHAFDHELEESLLRFFVASKLPVRFSSEERADADLVADPQLLALVDPLDGSHLAARGYPSGSIAISIVELETASPIISRIAEVFTGHQFSAFGGDAARDGQPIRPSDIRETARAFVVSYFASASRMVRLPSYSTKLASFRLVLNSGGLLDIAKVGSGQCEAMIEPDGMVAREYVAGVHIASAAGATASTMRGSPIPTLVDREARSDFLVSATPELHEAILDLWA
jgi:fructose-1,6-bisphosphatase/inositol monophosphatase family enzyme